MKKKWRESCDRFPTREVNGALSWNSPQCQWVSLFSSLDWESSEGSDSRICVTLIHPNSERKNWNRCLFSSLPGPRLAYPSLHPTTLSSDPFGGAVCSRRPHSDPAPAHSLMSSPWIWGFRAMQSSLPMQGGRSCLLIQQRRGLGCCRWGFLHGNLNQHGPYATESTVIIGLSSGF